MGVKSSFNNTTLYIEGGAISVFGAGFTVATPAEYSPSECPSLLFNTSRQNSGLLILETHKQQKTINRICIIATEQANEKNDGLPWLNHHYQRHKTGHVRNQAPINVEKVEIDS